jgi:hypothetical protein
MRSDISIGTSYTLLPSAPPELCTNCRKMVFSRAAFSPVRHSPMRVPMLAVMMTRGVANGIAAASFATAWFTLLKRDTSCGPVMPL